jgi:DNA-binding MarR family transcriptional regulator
MDKTEVNNFLNSDLFGHQQKQKRLPRRTSVTTVKMTMARADAIRHVHETTTFTQTEIAKLFGIDQGRVSKIVNNLWFPQKTLH